MWAKGWIPEELPWPSYFSLQETLTCALFLNFELILRNPTLPFQPLLRGQGSFGLQPHPRGYYNITSLSSDELSSKDIGFRAVFPLAECRRNHVYNTTNSLGPVLLKPRLHSAFGKIKLSSNFSQHNGIKPRDFQQTIPEEHLCQIRISRVKLFKSCFVSSYVVAACQLFSITKQEHHSVNYFKILKQVNRKYM